MQESFGKTLLNIRDRCPVFYKWTLFCVSWLAGITTCRKVRGKENLIVLKGAILLRGIIDVRGNNNQIIIAPECVLKNVKFFIRGNGHVIKIGPRVRVSRSALLWCEDERGSLIIGENTRIEGAHIAVTEPGSVVEIGTRCLFAYDIEIRCGDSHSIIDVQTEKRINFSENVMIRDRVWVGVGVKILKGVEVGSDSVIATGSVVTKSVPEGSVAAGNPAKVVRSGIRWEYPRL